MTHTQHISHDLERMIAIADGHPNESTGALRQRLIDLRGMLGPFRQRLDHLLSDREKNGHPDARLMAKILDTIQKDLAGIETGTDLAETCRQISENLSCLEDDWESFIEVL